MREPSFHPARLAVFREHQLSAMGPRDQGGAITWIMLTTDPGAKLQRATCLEDSITAITIFYMSIVQHHFGVKQNWG